MPPLPRRADADLASVVPATRSAGQRGGMHSDCRVGHDTIGHDRLGHRITNELAQEGLLSPDGSLAALGDARLQALGLGPVVLHRLRIALEAEA